MAWSKTSRHVRGYGKEWDKIRLVILRRDYGLCQCEECQGGKVRVLRATEVHHIMPKAKAKALGWTQAQMDDPANLQAINTECHKRETMKAQGKALKPFIIIGLDGYPQD